MIYPKKDGGFDRDATIDASLYGMFAFGVYDPHDVKVQNTMKAIEEALWVKTKIGVLPAMSMTPISVLAATETFPATRGSFVPCG